MNPPAPDRQLALEDTAMAEGSTLRCYATSCILFAKSQPDVDGRSGLPSLW